MLKIDLAKAFDRLEWSFISEALHRLGLNTNFINLIHACISTPTLAVLVNDGPSDYFNPQRGLRQGCPLSPYLFVIAINELSIRLQDALHNNNLSGISLGIGAPPIHSLLFADDLILCGKATLEEAQAIKTILYEFCQQSGQTPNLQKSSIYFSKNVPNHTKNQIKGIFLVSNLRPNTMHLGHPMIFSHRDKNKAYNFIYNKFLTKFGTLKANKLNHAGRLQYIKYMLDSIPIYYMSTVLFSKTFIANINTILRRFWWAGVQEEHDTSPIAFRSWEDICKSKEQGGLGIRDMEMVNKSLIIHSAWNVATNKNPFLTAILKAKYYPNGFLVDTVFTGNGSSTWHAIEHGLQLLKRGIIWQVGNGASIRIWRDPWIPREMSLRVISRQGRCRLRWVSELLDIDGRGWGFDKLIHIFNPADVEEIAKIKIPARASKDSLRGIWRRQVFLLSAAPTALNIKRGQGVQSTSSAPNGERKLWSRVWSGQVPPKVNVFIWKLAKDILPTRRAKFIRRMEVSDICPLCDREPETSYHAIITCPRAQGLRVAMREH